ncbi:hypothetical protein [Jeotgalibacillus marinus]|uniref:DUF4203 domain-containing protein n=1 Tax=Jeotgalibacillus marinus TaxID=86667 RepID=A0ABV3Q4W7_9BACL
MVVNNVEIFFTIALISLIIIASFALIALVLSFKKENRVCCVGSGILLAITSIAFGVLAFALGVIDEGGLSLTEFVEIFTTISLVVLLIIALSTSLFTLLAVKKNVKFCCLGGGIALAGIGIGAGLILSVSFFFNVFFSVMLLSVILSIITLVLISIVAFIVVLVSLKKCEGFCCLAGSIALVGVVIGWSLLGLFTNVVGLPA